MVIQTRRTSGCSILYMLKRGNRYSLYFKSPGCFSVLLLVAILSAGQGLSLLDDLRLFSFKIIVTDCSR